MKKLFLLLVAMLSIGACAWAQNRTVKGTVVDASNQEPLVGVSVLPEGSKQGTITDVDGNFTIVVAPNVKTLVFQYIGFASQTLPVSDKTMRVQLAPSANELNTVIVTGYGSGKKLGSVVGSVSVIGEKALENITTPSFVDALQGKVAGLAIASSSGDPSAVASVRMRGLNSLNADNTPLFILDGAPVSEAVFNTINPTDIESITVLKDAASVAIYGSRAANGVIVITSKKGKYAEKAKFTFRAKAGFSQMVNEKISMMSSEQNLKYRELTGKTITDEMRYAVEKLGINTDWRKQIFNGSAPTYSLEGAVQGGTEVVDYYLSFNHMDQQGIVDQSGMRRESIRVALSTRVTDWFRLGFQGNLGYQKYQTNSESSAVYSGSGIYTTNPMVTARKALPFDSPYFYTFDESGNVVWGDKAYYLHFSGIPTPNYICSIRNNWTNRVNFVGNLWEQFTPIKGLTIRLQQSVDAYDNRYSGGYYPTPSRVTPMGDLCDLGGNEEGLMEGSNSQTFSRYYEFTYDNTIEYRTKFNGVHNVSLLLGHESIYTKSNGFGVYVEGYDDRRTQMLPNGTFDSFNGGNLSQSIQERQMNSFFVSGSYNYAEKYFFDFNVRRDGSSVFPPKHRWATFWSVGGMWEAKQEKFLQNVTWIDTARLRVSYGTNGNSSFGGWYSYYGIVSPSSTTYNGGQIISISTPRNDDLVWENVGGLDVGLHMGLFGKLDFDIAFYNKNTTNMIVQVPYSATTGITANWGNIASMRNTGVDFDFSYTPIQTRDWLFEIHGNFNYNVNKITKLFNGLDETVLSGTGLILKKGHKAYEYYMVRNAGVDPRDGAPLYYTKEGNLTKVYNEERDAVCIDGKTEHAPFAGGFGFQAAWKGLSLLTDFTFAVGKYMLNNDRYFIENNAFGEEFNQMTTMLNVWTPSNTNTDIPAPGYEIHFDTHLLENASFMRLKTLTLQYAFPKNIIDKMRLTSLKLHFTGRNLLTFTGYTGYDPEPETNVVAFFYPNTRQYEFGLELSF